MVLGHKVADCVPWLWLRSAPEPSTKFISAGRRRLNLSAEFKAHGWSTCAHLSVHEASKREILRSLDVILSLWARFSMTNWIMQMNLEHCPAFANPDGESRGYHEATLVVRVQNSSRHWVNSPAIKYLSVSSKGRYMIYEDGQRH